MGAVRKIPNPTTRAGSPWRDILFSVSIANLAMINVWQVLLYTAERDRYFLHAFGVHHYASAALLLALLSGVIWGAVKGIRRADHPLVTGIGQACGLVLLVNVVEVVRESLGFTRLELLGIFRGLHGYVYVVLSLIGVIGVGIAIKRYHTLTRVVFLALLVLSPLVLGNIIQVVWHGASVPAISNSPIAAPIRKPAIDDAGTRTRVVWIVFDEFDYRLGFPDRPNGIDLPELDRLSAESFSASHALEPATHTATAIPALLLGRAVDRAHPTAANRFELYFDAPAAESDSVTASPVDFKEQPTFFHSVGDRGMRLGIVGIYHPYCRLFEGIYDRCHWDPFLPGGGIADSKTFVGTFASYAYKVLPLLSYRGEHIASIERSVGRGAAAAADPQLDAVFLHLPLPHSPYVYDQDTGAMTVMNFRADAYYEQMALADRSFGEIRQAMETTGTWERSIVLVTSDHGWRFASAHDTQRDHRVPFILKLPAQTERVDYDHSFRAWEANAILLGVLSGDIRAASEIADWLDARWPRERPPTVESAAMP